MERKTVLYIAVSLDGMIAKEDGASIGWMNLKVKVTTATVIFIRLLIQSF